jgi:hypothetical protein
MCLNRIFQLMRFCYLELFEYFIYMCNLFDFERSLDHNFKIKQKCMKANLRQNNGPVLPGSNQNYEFDKILRHFHRRYYEWNLKIFTKFFAGKFYYNANRVFNEQLRLARR